MRQFLGYILLLCVILRVPAYALQVEDLDPEKEWRTKALTIAGNVRFSTAELHGEMVTATRTWRLPWRPHPPFDPIAFKTDLERLARFYRAQGYYEAQVSYDLQVENDNLVTVRIAIVEGELVSVSKLELEVTDEPTLTPALDALRPTFAITEGQVFTEERYQETEAAIKKFLSDQHYGRATVERKATVLLDQHEARVRYSVQAGPPAVFGETAIEGQRLVEPELIARELTYKQGEPFSAAAIEESRKNLLKLDLFSSARFLQEETVIDPRVIPLRLRVAEKPFREWQAGIGFGTEDEVRGLFRWRHNNWFGGGRKLDVQVKASSLVRNIDVSFIQPYVFGSRKNRFSLAFRPQQLDEPGYLLNATRLHPRFEREISEHLSGYLGYRLEYDQLNDVSDSTVRILQEFQRKGALSGLGMGLVWSTVDNPLDATTGEMISFGVEQVGGVFGGDFEFLKLQGEARKYHQLTPRLVLAGRLKIGFTDPAGQSDEVPLFERFYAGGISSVRGYGRHRLGPISASDDPVGGRSLFEGGLELRRQFTEKLGGTLFLDFGQVSLKSFDVPMDDLKFASGFGVLYTTPIGPVLLALGFPFDPPRDDQPWQVHFSIGQFF
jgi:outer membrane protein insertion porin family/translocation and assembly module TamA